jgi:hypothetical protein
MTGVALLNEARARGVAVYRVGDRLRWRSSAPIPPDLLTQLSEHKSELLQVAPDHDGTFGTLSTTFSTAEDAALRDRVRADNPEILPPPNGPGPWRLVIETCEPRREQFDLNPWTKITNPARCIECDLVELELAVAHKNAGYETAFTRLVDEYIERLAACGCRVRLKRVS